MVWRWFGHVERRHGEYISGQVLRLELPSRRPRGKTERNFMDAVKENLQFVGVRKQDTGNRVG